MDTYCFLSMPSIFIFWDTALPHPLSPLFIEVTQGPNGICHFLTWFHSLGHWLKPSQSGSFPRKNVLSSVTMKKQKVLPATVSLTAQISVYRRRVQHRHSERRQDRWKRGWRERKTGGETENWEERVHTREVMRGREGEIGAVTGALWLFLLAPVLILAPAFHGLAFKLLSMRYFVILPKSDILALKRLQIMRATPKSLWPYILTVCWSDTVGSSVYPMY